MRRQESPNRNGKESDGAFVIVVDDDLSVREALSCLFRSVGLKTLLFSSGQELMESALPELASCIVLDIRLPGVSGLDFQVQLTKANIFLPVIMMTGHGDIPMSVRAMKAGAIDFLTKPFRDQDMLDAVTEAIAKDRERRRGEEEVAKLQPSLATLTERERDVMFLVAKGFLNKQIAANLGLSEITVKIHRSRLNKKMGIQTLSEIIGIVDMLTRHQAAKPQVSA